MFREKLVDLKSNFLEDRVTRVSFYSIFEGVVLFKEDQISLNVEFIIHVS